MYSPLVQREAQPIGVPVAAAVEAAFEAGVAIPGAEHGEALTLEQPARGPPAGRVALERRGHDEQRPPGQIRPPPPSRRRLAGLVQVGVELLRRVRRGAVQKREPVFNVVVRFRIGVIARRPARFPELQVHRLASDTPKRESFRAGNVRSGRAVKAGARNAASMR